MFQYVPRVPLLACTVKKNFECMHCTYSFSPKKTIDSVFQELSRRFRQMCFIIVFFPCILHNTHTVCTYINFMFPAFESPEAEVLIEVQRKNPALPTAESTVIQLVCPKIESGFDFVLLGNSTHVFDPALASSRIYRLRNTNNKTNWCLHSICCCLFS